MRRQATVATAVGVVFATIAFGPGWFMTAKLIAGRTRFGWRVETGRPDRETAAAQEAIRAVQALRARSDRVAGPVGLRQFGVPLAWTDKDVAAQSYSVSPALFEAADAMGRSHQLLQHPLTDESLAGLATLLDAQLFLLRRQQLGTALATSDRVLFENAVYAVVQVEPRLARDRG